MTDAGELRLFFQKVEKEGKSAISTSSDEHLQEAIDIASAEIDRTFIFLGSKRSLSQESAWPRIGVPGINESDVPSCVTQAAYFLGGAYLAGYRIQPTDIETSKLLVSCLFLILDPVIDPDASVRNSGASH